MMPTPLAINTVTIGHVPDAPVLEGNRFRWSDSAADGIRKQRVTDWTFGGSVGEYRAQHARRPQWDAYQLAKRTLDVFTALAVLALCLPLFAIVVILIKSTDGGPVLFWQQRVGRGGRIFWFPKFRSMVPNAEQMLEKLLHQNQHKVGVTFKLKDDPRMTWIGRILRRTSIDELPQLWCVLNGDMTLVGPRPAVPREVANYTLSDSRRLEAVPGLTCIWQVSGRSDIPFPQQVEMDCRYIENQSFWLDLKLLALTVPALITGKGAY